MRILFITFTNIGDVVLSTGLLERVLADHPDAIVDIVGGGVALTLFEGLPQKGELIPLIKKKNHMHYMELYRKLKDVNYDIIIDLRTPLLRHMLNGKKKIGYKPTFNRHKAEQLAKLWPSNREISLTCWVNPEVEEKIAQFCPDDRLLVAIAPTANWIGKQWPQSYFNGLNLGNIKGLENALFIVLGAAHEHETVKDFIESLPQDRTKDLVGRTSLPEAYSWLKSADLFIGNDSGLAHLAAAAQTPTLTLFGPTNETLYAPWVYNSKIITPSKRPSSELNLESVAMPRLITDISTKEVVSAIELMVQNIENTNKLKESAAC
jgi:ADP-heptose:LPS heptosyltransferase